MNYPVLSNIGPWSTDMLGIIGTARDGSHLRSIAKEYCECIEGFDYDQAMHFHRTDDVFRVLAAEGIDLIATDYEDVTLIVCYKEDDYPLIVVGVEY